jgi:hypothetical protein
LGPARRAFWEARAATPGQWRVGGGFKGRHGGRGQVVSGRGPNPKTEAALAEATTAEAHLHPQMVLSQRSR